MVDGMPEDLKPNFELENSLLNGGQALSFFGSELMMALELPGEGQALVIQVMGDDGEGRAAGQVPGVTLKSMADHLDGTGWPEDFQREIGEQPDPQKMVESDQMIDMQMREEKPADPQQVSCLKRMKSAAIKEKAMAQVLKRDQKPWIVKRTSRC